MRLDDTDRAILGALQQDARLPLAEVARRTSLSLATVHRKLQRLQRWGVVRGFWVALDPVKVGLAITAFVRLRLRYKENMERDYALVAQMPEVEEIHVVAGDYDLLVKLRGRDNAHVLELVQRIYGIMGFLRSNTEICLASPLERLTDVRTVPG